MDISNKEKEFPKKEYLNFIEQIIEKEIAEGKYNGRVHTRFPPEPNGYLHIGHAKSICLNFGLAKKYNGLCNLRFDDTNPIKEDIEYVESIKEDIKWLGFDWEDRLYYASDYFDQLYEWAIKIIKSGKAYVDDQTAEDISATRGTPTIPGKESPYRNRSVKENLNLFERMKNGEFEDGSRVLRAKIDMASPNMQLRDPAMYRIKHTAHHRTGKKWCIYPMYDFAHGQSDFIEGITNSICTLEFEVHKPLYDWYLDQIVEGDYRPVQTEFARLNLTYTVMSKRKLLELVEEGYVCGWDDPRMPTISGMRRRGYTPESIRNFAEKVGVAKRDNIIDVALLEYSVREDLNKKTNRVMAVLNPIKVILINYPENKSEKLEAINNPEDENAGKRNIIFTKELYIERDDFMEDAPKSFYRLTPGSEVRLRYAYIIKCENVIKNEKGEVIELHCTYDKNTKSGTRNIQRKVKSTIHWVSVTNCIEGEVRLYDRLFKTENPDIVEEGKDFKLNINPESLKKVNAYLEPYLQNAKPFETFQFERMGYFCVDKNSTSNKLIFNRTVSLKDNWEKQKTKQ